MSLISVAVALLINGIADESGSEGNGVDSWSVLSLDGDMSVGGFKV